MNDYNMGVGRKIAKGAIWMILVKVIERSLGLISTLILARILVPQDFGLIALAMSVLGILEILGSFGFDIALIQNQQAPRSHYDTAWSLTLVYGVISAILIIVLAVPATHFFREPRLELILYALAGVAILQGFENIGVVAFQKELDFRKEFNFRVIKKIIGFSITVTLAIVLRNYWALVIGALVSRMVGVALSYKLHSYRPRLSFVAIGDLWRFSGWMLVNNIVVFAAVKGYDIIVGRIAGASVLGAYTIAYEISNLPTTELVHPISRALFPGFARFADDRRQLRSALIMSMSLVAMIAIPLGSGIAILSEPMVRLMLGEKWLDTIPVIEVLAIYGVMRTAHAGTGAAYLAIGVPRVIAIINLPHIVVGWPMMAIALTNFGLVAASYAVLCSSALGLILNFVFARKYLTLTLKDVVGCFWRPITAVLVMVLFEVFLLRHWPPAAEVYTLLFQTVIYVIGGGVIFVFMAISIWVACGRPAGAERMILDNLFRTNLFKWIGRS